jgi:hypothetical protein
LTEGLLSIARAAACTVALIVASPGSADDCPSAAAGKGSFVVERGPDSKTEVFYGNGPTVQSIMWYRGQTLLETTLHEGLFELDRLDRGRRWVSKPKADLAKLFPLRQQKIDIDFDVQQDDGKPVSTRVKLTVIGTDHLMIGTCKYDILKIQRDETGARRLYNVDYYAPALKLIVAKEYSERDGRTTLIKFDKIYSSAKR